MAAVTTLNGAFDTSGERTICPTFICRPTNAALPGMPVHDGAQCTDFSHSPFLMRFPQCRESSFLDCPHGCCPVLLVRLILQHFPLPVNFLWKCYKTANIHAVTSDGISSASWCTELLKFIQKISISIFRSVTQHFTCK